MDLGASEVQGLGDHRQAVLRHMAELHLNGVEDRKSEPSSPVISSMMALVRPISWVAGGCIVMQRSSLALDSKYAKPLGKRRKRRRSTKVSGETIESFYR